MKKFPFTHLLVPLTIVSGLVLTTNSCSQKNSNSPGVKTSPRSTKTGPASHEATEKKVDQLDTDQDGLFDETEKEIGLHKEQTNLPLFQFTSYPTVDFKASSDDFNNKTKTISFTKKAYQESFQNRPLEMVVSRENYKAQVGKMGDLEHDQVLETLNLLQMTNYDKEARVELLNFILGHTLSHEAFSLQTELHLNISQLKGISKIKRLSYQVGLIDKSGKFESFGDQYVVKSNYFDVKGDRENVKLKINIQSLSSQVGHRIATEEGLNFGLKIDNFIYSTVDQNEMDYQSVLSNSLEKGVFTLILKKDTKKVYSDRKEKSLDEIYKSLDPDLYYGDQKKLFSFLEQSGKGASTDFDINNRSQENYIQELNAKSWQVLPSYLKTEDHPKKGEVLVLYFDSLKKMVKAKKSENEIQVSGKLSTDTQRSFTLENLKYGEVIQITMKAQSHVPFPLSNGKFRYEDIERQYIDNNGVKKICKFNIFSTYLRNHQLNLSHGVSEIFSVSGDKGEINLNHLTSQSKTKVFKIGGIDKEGYQTYEFRIEVTKKILDEFGKNIHFNLRGQVIRHNHFKMGFRNAGNCPRDFWSGTPYSVRPYARPVKEFLELQIKRNY